MGRRLESVTTFSEQFAELNGATDWKIFADTEAGLFDLAPPELARVILNENFRQPKTSANYGYAFESICEVVKKDLG